MLHDKITNVFYELGALKSKKLNLLTSQALSWEMMFVNWTLKNSCVLLWKLLNDNCVGFLNRASSISQSSCRDGKSPSISRAAKVRTELLHIKLPERAKVSSGVKIELGRNQSEATACFKVHVSFVKQET